MSKQCARLDDKAIHILPDEVHVDSITTASTDVYVNGRGVARLGDEVEDTNITTASSTVFVNGLPVARLTDSVASSDQIISASPDVFIG